MPTTNMGMTLPTEDGSSGTWDTLLNAALGVVDLHDHSSGKGVSVKTAGLSINADLTFGGFAATNLKAADFTPVATSAVSSLAAALFTNSADNELYWRTTAGVNVKLTAGTSLNAALLDGFTGDYGAGAEEASYTSSSSIYNFLKNSTTRAFLDTSDIRLFEATSGISNAVKLKSPASLAGSYTLTMPTALPASTSLVMLSSAGVLSTSLTPSLTTLALSSTLSVTGAATLLSTLAVTGLITATAGLTAAANQHVTVSGTGRFKHGSRTIVLSGNSFINTIPGLDYGYSSRGGIRNDNGAETVFRASVPLGAGKRITGIVFYVAHGSGATARTYRLMSYNLTTETTTNLADETSTASGGGAFSVTIPGGELPEDIAAGVSYWLEAVTEHTDDICYGVEVTYTEP